MASVVRRLRRHLRAPAPSCAVVGETFATYERPNLHLALEHVLGRDVASTPLGLVADVGLSDLARAGFWNFYPAGPPEFVDVAVGSDERLACVSRGLYLVSTSEGQRVALLLGEAAHSYPPQISLEAMSPHRAAAEAMIRQISESAREGKAYRGKVFSLERDCFGGIQVKFHHLPGISRNEIILPEDLIQRIERHTISFSRHAERLKAAGRHLKRGILLHGPPGTGKTLSAMYLSSQMEGRTVIILTGAAIQSIEAACHLARLLQPSTVVLEDVDLIGTERENQEVGANALLFELLNQMDGLGDDCDILFVLTTNRPDVLEPALSARPGRIDQALEIPLPDADCRRRLIQLYEKGLRLELADTDSLVARLEGTSAAFIREMLRKATLLAAMHSVEEDIVVRDADVNEALADLLVAGGPLTQMLLGARSS